MPHACTCTLHHSTYPLPHILYNTSLSALVFMFFNYTFALLFDKINIVSIFYNRLMNLLLFKHFSCVRYNYRTAVREAGYTEKLEELEQATTFLHENGILLHFDDSSLLSDLYFLDPQWLCSTLAKVITVQQKNPFQRMGKK